MKNIIFLVSIVFLISSCHVGRFVIRNFANITDYKFFENEEIEKAQIPFHFYTVDTSTLDGRIPKFINPQTDRIPFEEYLEDKETTAFIIIKQDSILYETYFNGYERESIETSFSMAKSYVSALIGICLEEGLINSTDDSITKYLDIFKNPGFDNITIQHLLDMQSGIKFNESYINPFGHVAKFYYGTNLKKYVSKLKIAELPGRFNYRSVDTQILGMLIEEVTGKSLAQNLEEKIWSKIGTEFDASWSLDSKKHKTAKAFSSLNARAIDYAKFGRLYLNNGNWDGKQVLPEWWVKESTTYSKVRQNLTYQNQWWFVNKKPLAKDSLKQRVLYTNKIGELVEIIPPQAYMAQGILGQYIYIDPEKELIIVRLGKNYGKNSAWSNLFWSISRLYKD
ncbi:MAG: serine hydrolase domain-containing protein [Lishizhenia sp.]